jgi:hypothetical protein
MTTAAQVSDPDWRSGRSSNQPLWLRISRIGTGRGDYELFVSDRPSPRELARPAAVGKPNEGTLVSNREEWWRVPVGVGSFVFEAHPSDSLDPVLTVYDADGIEELASDDDGGLGLGSRLEFANGVARTLLVKVSRGADVGTYRLDVTARAPPSELARAVMPNSSQTGLLDAESENWWKIAAREGRTYVFEADPENLLDTAITLYDADGATELAADDDGGQGLGSKIEFRNSVQRTLFIRVRRLDNDRGPYAFVVTETP